MNRKLCSPILRCPNRVDVVTDPQWQDQVWRTAVEWVIRSHGKLDPADLKELSKWLQVHPSHKEAYEEAARLWLLTGLVPPSTPHQGDE